MIYFSNRLYYKLILLFTVVFILIFSSCSDDIVVNTNNGISFDSARFNWKIDTIFDTEVVGIWSNDSSNVYCISTASNSMIHLQDGKTTYYYFLDFYPRFIEGISNNEIYIGGAKLTGNNSYKPHIKRWGGSSFSDIDINAPDTNMYIYNGAIKNSNEMWFATIGGSGQIIRYDGLSIYFYQNPDTSLFISNMFYENNNLHFISFEHQVGKPFLNFLYGFINNQWQLIFYNLSNINLREMNTVVFGNNENCIYRFNGNGFSEQTCVAYQLQDFLDGVSLNDFFCGQYDGLTKNSFLSHWNGSSWSKETSASLAIKYPMSRIVSKNLCYFKYEYLIYNITIITRGMKIK